MDKRTRHAAANTRSTDVAGPFGSRTTTGSVAIIGLVAVTIIGAALAGCAGTPDPVTEAVDPGWARQPVDESVEVEMLPPFIRLVDLALLRVGMTKEEVLAIFPDPDQIGLLGDDEMWSYGFAELHFRGNYLRDWFNL